MFCDMFTIMTEDDRCLAERIYEEYKKYIYVQAYKILNNEQDAEDVVDRVMIDVIQNINKFTNKDRNEIAAQIVIYTRNSAINIYRKNKRRYEVEICSTNGGADDNRETDFADESADIDSIVLNRETAEIIRKYILLLPQEYQDVISLVYGMGYSNVEAARILNITSNAVGLRIYKAKKKLLQMAGGELRERLE